jgi:DNA-binding transcriptional MerR regulator
MLSPRAPVQANGGVRVCTVAKCPLSLKWALRQECRCLGFSLEEIKQLTAIRADKAHASASVRQFLKTKLNGVKTRIRDIQQLETELKSDLGKCHHALKR